VFNTTRGFDGMVTAPHHQASQSGAAALREGGNAIEAMIAMAATIAVTYPHMNSIGGDGFWLISIPGAPPIGIQACGCAAAAATRQFYADRNLGALPARGGLAALTMAGTVAGWQQAFDLSQQRGGRLPLRRLLSDAIHHAKNGVAVSASQDLLTAEKLSELKDAPGFGEVYLPGGSPPRRGDRIKNPALASTLEHLAQEGLSDFYRGDVARSLATELGRAGSPLALSDFDLGVGPPVTPLSVALNGVTVFNMPPPTQGLASLLILALYEQLAHDPRDDLELVHGLVEATKQAFIVRNSSIWDPAYMQMTPADILAQPMVCELASRIDRRRALPWPHVAAPGDTVWMGAVDKQGVAVSFIQSLYWEFGSGVVSPSTGVLWQNRGISFSLDPRHPNRLEPGRLPFHTLNPALARFDDGRTMVYGAMGGDGQPQTQAAIFARYAWTDAELQPAVTAPRWLLGRTWGSESTNLKMEGRFESHLIERLQRMGHDIEVIEPFSDLMGHAGAIVLHSDGRMEGASDPRSDGAVAVP
jgi:gamma-glutamyltranspeptidase/glutathione hydrolase